MTAFSASDLPSSVTTVEELVVWATSILRDLNRDHAVVTGPSTTTPSISSAPYEQPADTSSRYRWLCYLYVPLSPDWIAAGRPWEGGVQTFSDDPIPSAYTS